jgi:hypothetical protein
MRTRGMIVTVLLISCLISGFLPSAGSGGTGTRVITADAAAVVAVTGVSLNKAATSIAAGGTETLVATVAPAGAANQNVTWSSDNAAATVAAGVVTGVSPGTAVITVTTLDGGKTATCIVTMTAAVPITLSLDPIPTTVGIPAVTVSGNTNADYMLVVTTGNPKTPVINGRFSVTIPLDFIGTTPNLVSVNAFIGTHSIGGVYDVYYQPKAIKMKLVIGQPTIWVDGFASSLEASPVIINSRTLVPIRAIVEPLGGIITWDATTSWVKITLGRDYVSLGVGNNKAILNGKNKRIDANINVVPVIINGRTMLPLRFVTESLEFQQVNWDAPTKTIELVYDGW